MSLEKRIADVNVKSGASGPPCDKEQQTAGRDGDSAVENCCRVLGGQLEYCIKRLQDTCL